VGFIRFYASMIFSLGEEQVLSPAAGVSVLAPLHRASPPVGFIRFYASMIFSLGEEQVLSPAAGVSVLAPLH
ncbi:hypothetical protein, partial [Salmonella enterica]|uniref:hypothetical protein n=1 Tax=Salmonella enterica TaxID=28901 RepID=UPI002FCDAE8C